MIMIFCLIKDPPLELLQLNLGAQDFNWHQLRTQAWADLTNDSDLGPR